LTGQSPQWAIVPMEEDEEEEEVMPIFKAFHMELRSESACAHPRP